MSIVTDFIQQIIDNVSSIIDILRFDFVFRFIPFLPADILALALACIWLIIILAIIRSIPVVGG